MFFQLNVCIVGIPLFVKSVNLIWFLLIKLYNISKDKIWRAYAKNKFR